MICSEALNHRFPEWLITIGPVTKLWDLSSELAQNLPVSGLVFTRYLGEFRDTESDVLPEFM